MSFVVEQKWTNGRATLKEILVPLVLILMTIYLFVQSASYDPFYGPVYNLLRLPPLSKSGEWGVFNEPPSPDDDNADMTMNYVTKTRMWYSPQNHPGVEALITALNEKYPSVTPIGCDDSGDVFSSYEENMFTTWASLEFNLSPEQIQTGSFFASSGTSNVQYTIRINPHVAVLPDSVLDEGVYKDAVSGADWWSKSGYLTLQNFVSTYLTQTYTADPTFNIDMFVQRYPYDYRQEESPGVDFRFLRFILWKWMGSTVLTLALFLPILMVVIQPVKERASKMKDLLNISGLLDSAYYASYVFGAYFIFMFMAAIVLPLLAAGMVLSPWHLAPYFAMMSCYGLALISFALAFGFVIPRPEFIGLPLFILQAALTVGGTYLANDYNMDPGLKLFIGTLFPPIGVTIGVFTTEVYLWHNEGTDMDFNHLDTDKNLPSLNAVCACLLVSAALYFAVAVGMPFDWLFADDTSAFSRLAQEEDEERVDVEEKEGGDQAALENDVLSVRNLTQIYPDGTKAVKGMTFSVANGEILSFLGANGAGQYMM
jgi:hypothetical protein